jgi:two-component system chemotaxis sensor kinase CheA
VGAVDDDAEIIAEFLVESHENLDQLDRDLVELERAPGSRELLSSIFRTIHTIKGTSGFLALNRLEALTHVGENLLSRLRDGELAMDAPVTEVLLRMVDTVRALLDAVEASGTDSAADVDVDSVVTSLKAVLDGDAGTGEPAQPEDVVPDAAPAPPRDVEPVETPAPPVLEAPHLDELEVRERLDVREAEDEPADEDPVKRGVVDSSVRVDVDLLDSLVQLVGELVLTRNQVLQHTEGADDLELVRAAQRLDLVASELQEGIMKTRMQPIGQVWSKMPRVVRDLAVQLGREVDLRMEGHDTELDRSLLEALKGPLTHLVRNALDHGIERPEDRLAAGKPVAGTLSLRAFHESGQVVVEITDDGKGIDPQVVAEAAVRRGVITREQANRMEQRELVNLVFRAGFSTAAEVTNVSGRGVGMDVVRTNIERIGGTVDIASHVGSGTTCRVRIPLTLAIIPALIVAEGGERYAIPQTNLAELVRLEGEDLRRNVETLAGAPVLRLRGRLLPLLSLSEALGADALESDVLNVVVLQADETRFGLCVAEIHDTQEIVVKPIGQQLKGLDVYAGATIMGDGRVALILNVAGLAANGAVSQAQVTEVDAPASVQDHTALLLLEVAGSHRAALPMRALSRLEEFGHDRVEYSGTAEAVQYRDGILPLVRLAPAIGLVDTADQQERLSVVVHESDGRSVGIVIDRVLDIVEATVSTSEVGRRAGVLGSAVVQGRVTDLVDLDAVVALSGAGVR